MSISTLVRFCCASRELMGMVRSQIYLIEHPPGGAAPPTHRFWHWALIVTGWSDKIHQQTDALFKTVRMASILAVFLASLD